MFRTRARDLNCSRQFASFFCVWYMMMQCVIYRHKNIHSFCTIPFASWNCQVSNITWLYDKGEWSLQTWLAIWIFHLLLLPNRVMQYRVFMCFIWSSTSSPNLCCPSKSWLPYNSWAAHSLGYTFGRHHLHLNTSLAFSKVCTYVMLCYLYIVPVSY